MNMVEQVARAICEASGYDPDAVMPELHADPKVSGTYLEWQSYTSEARAAIKAMREPTQAMTKCGVEFAMKVCLGSRYRWPDYIADKHRAMIDAALELHQ